MSDALAFTGPMYTTVGYAQSLAGLSTGVIASEQAALAAQQASEAQIAQAAAAQAAASAAATQATLAAAAKATAAAATIVLTGQSNSYAPGTAPGTVGSLTAAAANTGLLSPAGEAKLAAATTPTSSAAPTINTTPFTPLPTPTIIAPVDLTPIAPPAVVPDLVASAAPVVAPVIAPVAPPPATPDVVTAAAPAITPAAADPALSPVAPIDPTMGLAQVAPITPLAADPLNSYTPATTTPTAPVDSTFGLAPADTTPTVAAVQAFTNAPVTSTTIGSDPLAFVSPDQTTMTTYDPNTGLTTTDPVQNPAPPVVSSQADVAKAALAAATILASQGRYVAGVITSESNLRNIASTVARNGSPLGNVVTDISNQMGIGPAQGPANQTAAFIQGVMVTQEGVPLPPGSTVNDIGGQPAPAFGGFSSFDPTAQNSYGGSHHHWQPNGG